MFRAARACELVISSTVLVLVVLGVVVSGEMQEQVVAEIDDKSAFKNRRGGDGSP